MKYFKTPEFLHEVFGEKQSILEITGTILFALVGSWVIYSVAEIELDNWRAILAFILIADVLAGCIANFTLGTNEFYTKRPKNRLIFIAIHVHIIVIAWLLSQPLDTALLMWAYTIVAASVVNALHGKSIQGFIAANLMCYGIFLLIYLSLPTWFLMVSLFFMIKVLFSFAVDHYRQSA
ncbi:hypothetical protein H5187_16455 [Pseudoalteromonas sp. SG44-1]|uniref:hypothetical protein n=1 Tax=Pseudoalteromonas sp. SG44-1 TaxID=2760964 RepID=UPI0016036CD3|nr:hypothetical protein [Pseudoalteromonas sp. SG44-1]MBB1418849.1 hypothetical protein [Pseudoalteromonas sp. SG44-1]